MGFEMCFPSTLVPFLRSFKELFSFVESEILLSKQFQFGCCRWGRRLSDAHSFGGLERALEVGREDVSNLQILLSEIASQTIGLKNAMVRERRVCRASTES